MKYITYKTQQHTLSTTENEKQHKGSNNNVICRRDNSKYEIL